MLSGRLAFVTGGASGIGRAVCQVLAKDGAKVVVADVAEFIKSGGACQCLVIALN